MSKPNSRKNVIANLKRLNFSRLFRRLTLYWSALLIVLLTAILIMMVMVIRGIYVSSERRLAEQSIDSVSTIRNLYVNGGIDREQSRLLQRRIFTETGSSFFFFHISNALVIDDEGFEITDFSNKKIEPLLEYRAKLLAGEELDSEQMIIDGCHYIIAGRRLEYDNGMREVMLVLRNAERVYKRNVLITLLMIGAALLTLAVGIIIIMNVTGRYVFPFTELARSADEMSRGNLDVRVELSDDHTEIDMLSRLFNRVGESLKDNIQQIELQRSRLEQIVSSNTNGIAVTDENGELIQYNNALLELFSHQKPAEDAGGRFAVIPDPGIWERFDAVAASGGTEMLVYPVDSERTLWISIAPILSNEGRMMGVLGNFQDMTELERLERTRREYVANVSHELRRPLTALQGLLEPIRDGLVTDEEVKQRYYDVMLREIKRLTRLIADMMQLSRLQSDKVDMQIEPIDLSDTVRDVAESYRPQIEGAGFTLSVDAPEGLTANADADRVEQVLVILIDNAINYNVENGWIDIKAEQNGDGPSILVSNTGFGISEEDAPHIFDRFYTAKVAPPNVTGSTGLGLSIAWTIMEKMGGSITCISSLGGVTTMRVTFAPCGAEAGGEEAE